MGNLRACLVVAIMALSACGNDHAAVDGSVTVPDAPIDAKVWMDAPAPVFDFSCANNPAPTAATAQITLGGTVQEASIGGGGLTTTPLDNATVRACKQPSTLDCTMQANRYGSDTTDAQGAFSIGPIPTSSMPLNTYLDMTHTGSRETFLYPPQPLQADLANIPMVTFSQTLVSLLGSIPGGCTQNDASNGLLFVAVSDCANTAISDSANLQLVIKQGGNVVAGTTVIDLGAQNAQAAGTYIVCNVPANPVTNVGATYNGMNLLAHDVKIAVGTTTLTAIRPGYF